MEVNRQDYSETQKHFGDLLRDTKPNLSTLTIPHSFSVTASASSQDLSGNTLCENCVFTFQFSPLHGELLNDRVSLIFHCLAASPGLSTEKASCKLLASEGSDE